MEREEFEKLVDEAAAAVPEKFREKIKNVAFLVANRPTKEQLRENGIPQGDTLLGLYEGIPATERGEHYGVGITLPDRITIFQEPVEEAAVEDGEEVQRIIRETVFHEIAHYFGMSESEVEKWETEKRDK